ncbi:hypothetical protein CFC21_099941 [Triticum aestivum]|uniref:Ubiquitin-like domain-containing protein n=2 Tax=Triticum aestivum TaxID=4565 RepID=A0A3B6UA95_WHEAT|nr:polyubiquitin 12-like isoform X2 [Triticum aestivum]KAF7098181.1 hypothetical protein CFC21_099941 [Triticum aestivum]
MPKEVSSQNNADQVDIPGDLTAELRKLKHAYETLSSNREKEASAQLAVKDFLWNQLRTMDRDHMALLRIKEVEAAQATEAAQKRQQSIEELQVAARKKDDEIARLRAQVVVAENKVTSQKRRRLGCTFKIFVKIPTLDGKTIALEVSDSDTIFSVKAKIQDKEGIPAGQQRLMYINTLLVGSCALKDQNIQIQEEDILDLVIRGMHIFVKVRAGKSAVETVTLEVESSDTLQSVKAKIFDQTCMPPGGHRLFLSGKLLEDSCTLADYNIENDSILDSDVRSPWPSEMLRLSVKTPTSMSSSMCACARRRSTISRQRFMLSWAFPRMSSASCRVGSTESRLRMGNPC